MSVNNGYVNDAGRPVSVNSWVDEKKEPPPSLVMVEDDVPSAKIVDNSPTDEELEEASRNQEPLFFCKWITDRPGMFFGTYTVLNIVYLEVSNTVYVICDRDM